MNVHIGIVWLIVQAVGIVAAAMVVFDIVNLVRKASGRPLMLPRYAVMQGPRTAILVGLGLTLGATMAYAMMAQPG
jgi:hypothetical protein